MTKCTLSISDMHCSSCAMGIDGDLEDMDGIVCAKTSYARGESEVEYEEGKIKLPVIISKIKESGYTASIKSPPN